MFNARALGQSAQAEQDTTVARSPSSRFSIFVLVVSKECKPSWLRPRFKVNLNHRARFFYSRSRYRLNRLFLLQYVANVVVLLLVVLRLVFVTQAIAEATLSATYLPACTSSSVGSWS